LYGEWPPKEVREREAPAYTKMMEGREVEIMTQMNGSDERWSNWNVQTQLRLVKSYTKLGFEKVKTPPEVHELLRNAVEKGVQNWDSLRNEHLVDVIYHPEANVPKFIDIGELSNEVHRMMLPYHEEWSGLKLNPTSIYGVRLYQNGSSLTMHVDRVKTHVISSIVHIAHEYDNDAEPWPLDIEGHDGQLYHVVLQPGEMVFYESAKCLHGRMSELKGKYYGSIFIHYRPVSPAEWPYTQNDIINAVPPKWSKNCDHPHGARWAGSCITVDSRVAVGAPPREGSTVQEDITAGEL
jgi:hypothetical protein